MKTAEITCVVSVSRQRHPSCHLVTHGWAVKQLGGP